jgi:hypothetical protein
MTVRENIEMHARAAGWRVVLDGAYTNFYRHGDEGTLISRDDGSFGWGLVMPSGSPHRAVQYFSADEMIRRMTGS